MKKLIVVAMVTVMLATCCFGAVACTIPVPDDNTPDATPVSIKYEADGSSIIPLFLNGSAEYAVLGEPAATNLVNKMKKDKGVDVYTVFDLQEQWKSAVNSSSYGYPQACMIVKKELLESKDFVDALVAALNANAAYISNNLSTLKDTMTAAGSSLTVNYTDALISRCNLGATLASQDGLDSDVNKYLAEFGFSVDADKPVNKLPDSGFYFDGTAGQSSAPQSVSIYAPDGAPALSIAKIIADGKIGNTAASVTITTGENVVAKAMIGDADIVVLPTNAAAKAYNSNGKYQMFSVNVFGVLYVVSTHNITSLSDLCGKTVYSIGLGNTPEYVFKKVLDNAGLTYIAAE